MAKAHYGRVGRSTIPNQSMHHLIWFHQRVLNHVDSAIILVVDSTDRERLPIAQQELHKMASDESLAGAAMLVLANKQDVRGYVLPFTRPAKLNEMDRCMNAAEISAGLDLTRLKDRQWHIVACSALTGKGLEEGLDWLTLRMSG